MNSRFEGDERICILALDHTEKQRMGYLDLVFAAANTAVVILKVLRLSVN